MLFRDGLIELRIRCPPASHVPEISLADGLVSEANAANQAFRRATQNCSFVIL
jgi:hypothetical protein